MFAQSQWFHWIERFTENYCNDCYLTNAIMETTNKVDTGFGSFSYLFKMEPSLTTGDGISPASKNDLDKNSRGYYQMNLKWSIVSTQVPPHMRVEELKLQHCAIKISMVSSGGEEYLSKWLHLEPSEEEETSTWKDFIEKAKWQLILGKGPEAVSWKIVVFGRLYIQAEDCLSILPHDYDHGPIDHRVSAFQINNIPCVWNSFNSEDSNVILFIDQRPEEMVVANKFLVAACSPVLRKMLFEINTVMKDSGRIPLKNTSFLALKMFVGLISGDKAAVRDFLEMSSRDIFQVLDLAHRCQVDGGIIDSCTMVVMAKTDSEMEIAEVCHLFRVGKSYNVPDLCTRSFEWIRTSCSSAAKWEEIWGFLEKEASDMLSEYCFYFTVYSNSFRI